MSNLLERLRHDILYELVNQFPTDTPITLKPYQLDSVGDILTKTALSAICDEIDEGGIESALESIYALHNRTNTDWDNYKKEFKGQYQQNINDMRLAITTYLNHLKSTTEMKGAV